MNIWDQHFGLADDGLRACIFGDYIWRQKVDRKSAWVAIADMCYADAVISWNQLFGQHSQETHWSKLVSQLTIPPDDKLKLFGKEMIIDYLGISNDEWNLYHQRMVETRNVRIAHLNVTHSIDTLPNITKAMQCCYLYRDWLTEALHFGNRQGFNINVSEHRASDAVKIYKEQIYKAFNGL